VIVQRSRAAAGGKGSGGGRLCIQVRQKLSLIQVNYGNDNINNFSLAPAVLRAGKERFSIVGPKTLAPQFFAQYLLS
jgi:hypothetical protein